ncbi:MAG: glucose-1-phosphate thymidylyltransferase, partial [Candidatus Magasanikbacteria bacterium CG10_big_fil_rev_8_21_14_0_10_40_10]
FFKAFDNIKPSARGEYEIPDIYSYLIKNNYQVGYKEITGWWKDTGKPDDLLLANALLMDQKPADFWTRDKIKLGAGVKIGANVELIGPAIIGRDCRLDDCHIGPHTYLGDNCHLKSVKVENSLIFDNCQIECNRQIRNSIIGRNAVIREQAKDDSANNLIVGDNSLINL